MRNSRVFFNKGGAGDDRLPLLTLPSKKTLKSYYLRILPCAVRKGDRAIQARLNVRNDLIAWISHHCMIAAVTTGADDDKTWPHSSDKSVSRTYSCLNIDALN